MTVARYADLLHNAHTWTAPILDCAHLGHTCRHPADFTYLHQPFLTRAFQRPFVSTITRTCVFL